VTLKALEPRRAKVIEGCGFALGFVTRRYRGEIRAIFTLAGYDGVSRVMTDDGAVVDEIWCTGPEKVILMFT
jgi:hypothetical protein